MKKVILIEDDEKLRKELIKFLENNGYNVEFTTDFEDSVKFIIKNNADIVLLDINLPKIDGEYILKEIRKESDIPIIMLTSRNNEVDELISINYGADDYITKPYNPRILIARMEATLKRANKEVSDFINYKGLKINLAKSSFEYMNEEVSLSKNELQILYHLMDNRGSIVSRDELMDNLWDNDAFVDDNTLTVNINRLRSKLTKAGIEENFIETKRGQGYIIL